MAKQTVAKFTIELDKTDSSTFESLKKRIIANTDVRGISNVEVIRMAIRMANKMVWQLKGEQ